MKKTQLLSLITCLLAVAMLAGCGNTPPADSSSQAESQAVSSESEVSSVESGSASAAEGTSGLEGILDSLTEAAALGGTIKVSEIDMTASGIDMENIESFVGVESQLSVENGGIVLVIQAVPGAADTVKADLETFKETRASDDRYAEFEQARQNTENARIAVKDDLVVYAVSAEGDAGLDKLDAAIAEATA